MLLDKFGLTPPESLYREKRVTSSKSIFNIAPQAPALYAAPIATTSSGLTPWLALSEEQLYQLLNLGYTCTAAHQQISSIWLAERFASASGAARLNSAEEVAKGFKQKLVRVLEGVGPVESAVINRLISVLVRLETLSCFSAASLELKPSGLS